MKFDNKQFESGVKTSLDSLKNFEKGLQLKNAGKGLDNLQAKTSKFSLDGISSGLSKLSDKFSTLGIIGITALQNITNSALDAGKKIAAALTIDPIKSGFQEYELKMDAIKTIMSGTGRSMEDVNGSLDRMNKYSDRTIYSFADMTSNVGKFTNSGMKLEDAEVAMMGITNWAALAGAGTQQASMAMYNLSQAMSMGKLTVMDYKSIENANMATQQFKQHMIDTGVEVGTLKDLGKGMYQDIQGEGDAFNVDSFRNELNSGWADTEVMTKALKEYGDEHTELGKKAFKAATEITSITLLVDTMKEAVQSGWTTSWEMIIGDKEQSVKTLTALGGAFEGLIKPGIEARNTMLEFWNVEGGRDDVIEGLKNTFKGLGQVIGPVKEAFREIFPAMTGPRLVEISAAFKKLTENFKMSSKTSENLKRTFKGVFALFSIGKQAISAVAGGFFDLVKAIFPVTGGLLNVTGGIGDFIVGLDKSLKKSQFFKKAIGLVTGVLTRLSDKLPDLSGRLGEGLAGAFGKVGDILGKLNPMIKKVGGEIKKVFKKIQETLFGGFDTGNYSAFFDAINVGFFAAIFLAVKKFISNFPDLSGIAENITGLLDGVKGSLKAFQADLKAKTLMKIAVAMGILAVALAVLAQIDSDKLTVSLGAMAALFTELFVAMAIFDKVSTGFSGVKMAVLSASMIMIAVAIGLLAGALKKISGIPFNSMIKGLFGLGVVMGGLALFMRLLPDTGSFMGQAASIVILAVALNIMAGAVEKMGSLAFNTIVKGLIGIAGALTILGIFVKAMQNSGSMMGTATGILILAVALNVMAGAVEKFGTLAFNTMAKGLIGIGAALLIVAASMRLMPSNLIVTAAGLAIFALALSSLGSTLNSIGAMSWEEIGKGLSGLVGLLTAVVIAMNLMAGTIPGAIAMGIVAGALNLLVIPLMLLGGMSWEAIVKGLVGLGGAILVMGLAAGILAPLVPAMMGLGIAIALIGAGVGLAGLGLTLFAAALTAVGIAGVGAATALVGMVTILLSLIPTIVAAFGRALILLADVIINAAPKIFQAFKVVVLGLIDVIVEVTPKIVDAMFKLLIALVNKITEHAPKLIDAGVDLLIALMKGLIKNVGKLVTTAVDLMVAFLKGISDNIGRVIQSGVDTILSFIEGMTKAISDNTGRMTTAIGGLMKAIGKAALEVLGSFLGGFLTVGGKLIGGLISGIGSMIGAVGSKVLELGNAAKDKIDGFKDKFMTAGKNVVGGFIKGLGSRIKDITSAASDLGKKAYNSIKSALKIKSPSRLFAEVGNFTAQGFIVGMDKMISKVGKKGADLGNSAYDAIQRVIDDIPDDPDFNPTVTPVLNLDDARKDMAGLFSDRGYLDVNSTSRRVSGLALDAPGGYNNTSTADNSVVTMNNYYTVRNDEDINTITKKVTNRMYDLQKNKLRGRGKP